MITDEAFAVHYKRWGFRRIEPGAAPAAIRRNYRIGRLGGTISVFMRQHMRRLVILDRSGPLTHDGELQDGYIGARLASDGTVIYQRLSGLGSTVLQGLDLYRIAVAHTGEPARIAFEFAEDIDARYQAALIAL